jgi:hypothetical protein
MPSVAADCGSSPVQVERRCLHEFLARQLRDRLLVIRNQRGSSWLRDTTMVSCGTA